jgi:AraC family transcriptional regulator
VHRTISLADWSTLHVFATVHPSRTVLPRHEHSAAYISLVCRGDYVERVGPRSVHCSELRVRFHPAGEEHENHFGSAGASCINIELRGWWQDEFERLGFRDPTELLISSSGAWIGLQIEREARRGDADSHLLIESLLARLLTDALRLRREASVASRKPRLRKAMEFLHDNATGAFSLAEVARTCGLHPTHLARAFKEQMGVTVGQYARRLKVLSAQDSLVRHPRWPLSRVAVEAGFADHAHLTHTFAATVGIPPSRMRRAALAAASLR